jgi:transposase-like protein
MTNFFQQFNLPFAKAICYSGFRDGQQPGGITPSYEEIKEDLLHLKPHWNYLSLYDCDEHALTVIKVIQNEKLDFKIMLGAYIVDEMNNHGCPWNGGVYDEKQLEENVVANNKIIQRLIDWSNQYPEIIKVIAVGNEAMVKWATSYYVSPNIILKWVNHLQQLKDENGLPKEQIFITHNVENTEDEAKAVKELIKNQKNIILVTSAFHMYRAKMLFEKQGFKVSAFKVDFKTTNNKNLTVIDFLPNANKLKLTETGIRELLGRLFYYFK